MIQRTRNKLEILATIDAQVYTKIIDILDKGFNDWVQECIMNPNDLDAIDWEVIDFIDIISNINNMDFQPGALPQRFRIFYSIDTQKTKGSKKKIPATSR